MSAATAIFGHGYWLHERQNDPFPPSISGLARAIDGDSLWVGPNEVRLQSIDAPESRQTCERDGKIWNCGEAARDELIRTIGKEVVTCQIGERDVYGRLLGRCTAGERILNARMVMSGMAIAYGDYRSEEAEAEAGKRGMWIGEFEEPRKWRTEHKLTNAR